MGCVLGRAEGCELGGELGRREGTCVVGTDVGCAEGCELG